ncbi:anion permease [Malaciobacter mytili]|uniref:Anion permease n=1 Tax=Malaciobacter mytili LMG 24559 TaxID=1032238 RepID=A0AAX2AE71_9BACT|nr:DASS family sodium-coupled anion symporter [Malaciobacter mytili]AXH16092.1 sodium:sulfate symporter family protein [Malaciobacter mytili LMG 24559]RXI48808.1 anion permease [Malaciobacter mytili]RXK14930.1 anion permease [Malaciobacter mytili LMG 24559]
MSQTTKSIIPLAVLVIFWFLPAPEGLSIQAWHFLAVFFAVVVGLIIEPVPAALIGFAGISFVAVFGLAGNSAKANIAWALSGFSNTVIWLIFAAFMFALGYKKTGLGRRVSLIMIKYMGKSSLGLGYAVAFSDLVLAPFMPSNTARSAGTIYPVASNIPLIFNSTPDNEPRKLGAYISWVAIATTCVTSSMFLTALAPNLLAVDLINQGSGNLISWSAWASIMLPLMIPLFLLTPWLVYVIYPPTQKTSPEAPAWAAKELEQLGSISKKELLMAGLAVVALLLWIFGKSFGIHSTTAAIAIVSIMVLSGIITWDDVISNKAAFNVLIWFASLVAMAAGLKKVGVLDWIGKNAEVYLSGLTPTMLILSMLVLFFILHYFFASTTAHTTALMPIFIAIAMKLMTPDQLVPFSILLAGSLGVMGIITPYATGPSPIWYGANYISQATWWGLGAIFGALYLAAILIGSFIFI